MGTLDTVSLDNPRMPKFHALAYVWGNPSRTRTIWINSSPLEVTLNLYDALESLREVFGTIVTWIDSICINQQNLEEKNNQVQLMRVIYSTTELCLAWLGPESKQRGRAFDFLDQIYHAESKLGQDSFKWIQYIAKVADREPYSFLRTSSDLRDLLVYNNYWRRVWICQEFVLPKKVMLVCGRRILNSEVLKSVLSIFWAIERGAAASIPEDLLDLFREPSMEGIYFLTHYRSIRSSNTEWIYSLVQKTIRHVASDPRDKIWALLSISVQSSISPDYRQPVENVYSDFARKWIEDIGDLNILANTDIGIYHFTSSEESPPS
jgi:hypothetical protein